MVSRHQYFALVGLVPISAPLGRECRFGLEEAGSSVELGDVAFGAGMFLAGALLSGLVCPSAGSPRSSERDLCNVTTMLAPMIAFQSQTVHDRCVPAPEWLPNPAFAPPPPRPTSPAFPPPSEPYGLSAW